MRNASLARRVSFVAAGVAALVAVLVGASLLAVLSLRNAERRETRSKDVAVASLHVRTLAADLESALRGYALSDNSRFLALFRAARARVPVETGRLSKLVADDPVQLHRSELVRSQLNDYVHDYAENVIVIAQISRNAARGTAANDEGKRRTGDIKRTLDALLTDENARAQRTSAHARTLSNVAVGVGIGALAVSTLLVLLFGGWVARSVARPVRRVAAAASDVANGRLDVRLEEGGTAEVGALVSAFNSMTRALETSHEELVRQNELLRESERQQRDLIGMVSHELRTPLAAVLGFTSLLIEREYDAEERHRYLEIVQGQARRLARLAEDFLDVQLLEGGGLTLVRERFDLVDLVREQARLFFLDAGKHEAVLDLPGEPVEVDADRDRLAQVVGNLISNAVKYSPDGGEVRVELRVVDDEAVVAVHDEGVGIAPEDTERIFEKFFRSDDAASTIGGTGLGLAVAREIVRSHGGTIDVQSELGRGSTFTVRLPVAGRSLPASQGNPLRRVV